MSAAFVVSLGIVVALLIGARLVFANLPVRRVATRLTAADATLFGVGVAGLIFHCVVMFFPRLIEPLPGSDPVMLDISALGTASIIWYVVPVGLVLAGLRRQYPVGLVMAALSLVGVGITMYNGGSLQVHVFAIFMAALLIAGVAAALVIPPWQGSTAAPLRDGRP